MKKRKNKILLVCSLLLSLIACSQQPDFVYMSYNVENLFDTIDNPQKNDDEFLPSAPRHWNSYRYQKKLKNIAKVIVAASQDWHNPDVIGLCEVENDTCLRDLLYRTNLHTLHYKFIHYESEDARGIDVALLYNEQTFTPIEHRPIRFIFDDSTKKTRDLLYVKGLSKQLDDTIHIFVCHFPSRRGGKLASEPFRITAAVQVRQRVDSIFKKNPSANIIIAGDFNDYPHDKSIVEGLQARSQKTECSQCLVNLEDPQAEGTYKFQGQWNFLDQAIVSNSFCEKYKTKYQVLQNDFLFTRNEKNGEKTPYRTYGGTIYKGGISDHLPILIMGWK